MMDEAQEAIEYAIGDAANVYLNGTGGDDADKRIRAAFRRLRDEKGAGRPFTTTRAREFMDEFDDEMRARFIMTCAPAAIESAMRVEGWIQGKDGRWFPPAVGRA